jgi:octaprenyl-diphosphate synthase
MRSILKRKKLSNEDKKAINQFVKENNGFKYAENVMSEYKNKALKILETFPDNESKNSLKILLDYIIDRKY